MHHRASVTHHLAKFAPELLLVEARHRTAQLEQRRWGGTGCRSIDLVLWIRRGCLWSRGSSVSPASQFARAPPFAAAASAAAAAFAGVATLAGVLGANIGGGQSAPSSSASPTGAPLISTEDREPMRQDNQPIVFNISMGTVYSTEESALTALTNAITREQNRARRGAPRRNA